jgi:hypothetical protein
VCVTVGAESDAVKKRTKRKLEKKPRAKPLNLSGIKFEDAVRRMLSVSNRGTSESKTKKATNG